MIAYDLDWTVILIAMLIVIALTIVVGRIAYEMGIDEGEHRQRMREIEKLINKHRQGIKDTDTDEV